MQRRINMAYKDDKGLTKGEHFHGNNPDMKLDFPRPDEAEIAEMNYKKPITSYKNIENPKKMVYADGESTVDQYTDNVNYAADTKNLPTYSARTKGGRLGNASSNG